MSCVEQDFRLNVISRSADRAMQIETSGETRNL